MASLLGTERYTIDKKGRVAIPVQLRRVLNAEARDTFVVVPGADGSLDLYPRDEWPRHEERLRELGKGDPRVRKFLQEYQPPKKMQARFRFMYLRAMVRSVVRLGIIGRERYQYWKLFFWSLIRRPRLFPLAITLSIYGFHFRQVFRRHEKRLRTARA